MYNWSLVPGGVFLSVITRLHLSGSEHQWPPRVLAAFSRANTVPPPHIYLPFDLPAKRWERPTLFSPPLLVYVAAHKTKKKPHPRDWSCMKLMYSGWMLTLTHCRMMNTLINTSPTVAIQLWMRTLQLGPEGLRAHRFVLVINSIMIYSIKKCARFFFTRAQNYDFASSIF